MKKNNLTEPFTLSLSQSKFGSTLTEYLQADMEENSHLIVVGSVSSKHNN